MRDWFKRSWIQIKTWFGYEPTAAERALLEKHKNRGKKSSSGSLNGADTAEVIVDVAELGAELTARSIAKAGRGAAGVGFRSGGGGNFGGGGASASFETAAVKTAVVGEVVGVAPAMAETTTDTMLTTAAMAEETGSAMADLLANAGDVLSQAGDVAVQIGEVAANVGGAVISGIGEIASGL